MTAGSLPSEAKLSAKDAAVPDHAALREAASTLWGPLSFVLLSFSAQSFKPRPAFGSMESLCANPPVKLVAVR